MDSIKGHHNGLKDLVQSYLSEEWKDRKKDTYGEDFSSRFLNMPFLPVEVPQQENSFDCGLFLLHYLELFVAQVPFDFNPFTPTKLSNFLNVDWFPPADAYLKRPRIHKLIFELVENHGSHEGFSPDDDDNQHCSEYIDNSSIGGQCHLFNGEASTSQPGQGIEMFPSYNTSNMVLKQHFEPVAASGTSLRHCQSFDQRSLSSSNHLFNSSRHRQSFDQRSLSSSNHFFNSSRHCQPFEQQSLSSSNHLFNSSRHCQSFDQRSLLHMNDSTGTINFPVDPLIDISQHSNMMSIGNKNLYPHLSYQGTPTLQLHHVSDYAVDNNVINDDVQIIDNINLDFWNERPPNKTRLMPPWVEVMESLLVLSSYDFE